MDISPVISNKRIYPRLFPFGYIQKANFITDISTFYGYIQKRIYLDISKSSDISKIFRKWIYRTLIGYNPLTSVWKQIYSMRIYMKKIYFFLIYFLLKYLFAVISFFDYIFFWIYFLFVVSFFKYISFWIWLIMSPKS